MGKVCNLQDFRCQRAWQSLGTPLPSPRWLLDAWALAFRAQAAGVAYCVAMGRFHAQLLNGGPK